MFVEVDGALPRGPQALEEDETIEVLHAPLGAGGGGLEAALRAFEARGDAVWVGLHAVAQGMRLGAMFGGTL